MSAELTARQWKAVAGRCVGGAGPQADLGRLQAGVVGGVLPQAVAQPHGRHRPVRRVPDAVGSVRACKRNA